MNKDTFCAYPFSTLFLGADGGVKPCCSAQDSLGNINEYDIEDIVFNSAATELRDHIVNEEWHPTCRQCKYLESVGARTERLGSMFRWEEFKDAGKNTFDLKKIDLRWSNTCNLSCNYCYPFFSSKWASIMGETVNENKKSAEEKVFSFLEKNQNTIDSINLLGGEPLLQKQNRKLLDIFPNTNYYILTNLAVDLETNDIAQRLLKMPTVEWGISFETVYKKFEYVRHGADWHKFTDNLQTLKKNNVKIVNAHPLYCTYTAHNLVEYYEYVLSQDLFDSVYWHAIQNIAGLDVFNMDKKFKERAILEIEKVDDLFHDQDKTNDLITIKQNLIASLDQIPKINGKEHFLAWTLDIEEKYLVDKKYKFKELWPDLFLTNN